MLNNLSNCPSYTGHLEGKGYLHRVQCVQNIMRAALIQSHEIYCKIDYLKSVISEQLLKCFSKLKFSFQLSVIAVCKTKLLLTTGDDLV